MWYRWRTTAQLEHHSSPVLSLCSLPCPDPPSKPAHTPCTVPQPHVDALGQSATIIVAVASSVGGPSDERSPAKLLSTSQSQADASNCLVARGQAAVRDKATPASSPGMSLLQSDVSERPGNRATAAVLDQAGPGRCQQADTAQQAGSTHQTGVSQQTHITQQADTRQHMNASQQADITQQANSTHQSGASQQAHINQQADTRQHAGIRQYIDATQEADSTHETGDSQQADGTHQLGAIQQAHIPQQADTRQHTDASQQADLPQQADSLQPSSHAGVQVVWSGDTNGNIAAWLVPAANPHRAFDQVQRDQNQQQQVLPVWSSSRWHQSGVNAMHAAWLPSHAGDLVQAVLTLQDESLSGVLHSKKYRICQVQALLQVLNEWPQASCCW